MEHRSLERISMHAWPCLREEAFDGWTLRFAEGYTKRANSVYPLGESTLPLTVKVDHCESIYAKAGLPVIFKLPEGNDWSALDQYLDGRGYGRIDESSVHLLELDEFTPGLREDLRLRWVTASEWAAVFYQFQHGPIDIAQTLLRMISQPGLPLHFALLEVEGEAVACGLVAGQSRRKGMPRTPQVPSMYGLFDLVVKPDVRGRGYGRWLVNGLLEWCKLQGGSKVYLQVLKRNERARKLYDSFGFIEVYKYWYRYKDIVKKGDDRATVVQ